MAQRGPKKQKQAFSFMIETELFVRLKKAALENNFTMTDIIHNTLESYLAEHDKYYNPNDMQPEDLQKEQAEAEAEAKQWTPPAPEPSPDDEEEEEIENPDYGDPPPGYQDEPESSDQDSQKQPFEFE